MHSFIVTNWNSDFKTLPKVLRSLLPDVSSLHHPDVFLIEPALTIGITQIRQLKTWLSRKPYQASRKLALLLQAHTLTLPAQNALLKSLEEPPPDTIIILATDHPDSLIPTINSRCQLVQLQISVQPIPDSLKDIEKFVQTLSQSRVGERITLANQYSATKDQAISLCLNLTKFLKSQLKTSPTAKLATQLRLLQKAHTQLQTNVNPKLVLEHLLVNL